MPRCVLCQCSALPGTVQCAEQTALGIGTAHDDCCRGTELTHLASGDEAMFLGHCLVNSCMWMRPFGRMRSGIFWLPEPRGLLRIDFQTVVRKINFWVQSETNERASYNGSIEASQASDVGSIPIARSSSAQTVARSLLPFAAYAEIIAVAEAA